MGPGVRIRLAPAARQKRTGPHRRASARPLLGGPNDAYCASVAELRSIILKARRLADNHAVHQFQYSREGGLTYEERIIRRGDQSPGAMREKARFVLGAMELRMAALGFGWADVTATQVYTIFDIYPLLANEFVRRGAITGGLTWHFARPPVQGLDFEVDVRGVAHELVI